MELFSMSSLHFRDDWKQFLTRAMVGMISRDSPDMAEMEMT